MTRIWTEGFEMRDVVGYTTTGAASTTQKRSGGASIVLTGGQTLTYSVSDLAEAYIRFGIYWSGDSTTSTFRLQFRHGTTVLDELRIDLNTDGFVDLIVDTTLQDTGVLAISESQWYLIELRVKIDDAAGILDAKVDGVPDATFSGDTKPGADAHFDNIYFYNNSSTGGLPFTNTSIYLDDIALNDTAGGVDNSWCGDGKIIVILPNGTVTNQLTGSDGDTTNNHLLVDEVPKDNDTTYVQGNVVNEEDLYDLAACGLTDVIINRIWAEARAKDTVASGGTIALVTKASGGAEVAGADVTLATTYTVRVLSAEQLVNPVDAAAWEVADIDALQGGPRTRS
jgi:hypothetical protein